MTEPVEPCGPPGPSSPPAPADSGAGLERLAKALEKMVRDFARYFGEAEKAGRREHRAVVWYLRALVALLVLMGVGFAAALVAILRKLSP